jgi:hypothetical protein
LLEGPRMIIESEETAVEQSIGSDSPPSAGEMSRFDRLR